MANYQKKILAYIIFIILSFNAKITSNQKFTIWGRVIDKTTSEPLPYANVFLKNTKYGAITDNDGFFRIINIPAKKYIIIIQYIGYETFSDTINITQNVHNLVYKLTPTEVRLKEVVISGEKVNQNSSSISQISLNPKNIKLIPSMGEPDILRTLQMLPGVSSSYHFSTDFHVRGGKEDENLILLDNIPIYNPSHLGGLFSTFDINALKTSEFSTGFFMPEFGGRTSSLLSLTSRDGKMDKIHITTQISLISSKALIEGPINKKLSFMASFRRTYADKIVEWLTSEIFPYYFYDNIIKLTYNIDNNNILRFNSFAGKDIFYDPDDEKLKFNWGNNTYGITWKHINSALSYWETICYFSKFNFNFKEIPFLNINNKINDFTLKINKITILSDKISLKNGIFATSYHNSYKIILNSSDSIINYSKKSYEIGAYTQGKIQLNNTITSLGGVRFDYFSFNSSANIEPRIAFIKKIDSTKSINYGLSYMTQNIVSIVDETSILKLFNVWEPISKKGYTQNCLQNTLGFEIQKQNIKLSINAYYKRYFNIAIRNYYKISSSDNTFDFERGEAYGSEFYLQYKYNNIFAIASYSLSKIVRVDKKTGLAYYPDYDRRHNFKFNIGIQLTKSLKISTNGNISSGNWFIKSYGEYLKLNRYDNPFDQTTINPVEFPFYSQDIIFKDSKNKMPMYKRIDLNLYWEWKRFEFYIQVLNIFNFKNYIFYDENNEGEAYMPIFPSLGITYKF